LGARTVLKDKTHSTLGGDILPKMKHLSLHVRADAAGGKSNYIYNAGMARSISTDFPFQVADCYVPERVSERCFHSPDDRTS
jgi:hypothetical protein